MPECATLLRGLPELAAAATADAARPVLNNLRKIVVLRALHLGDLLCAVPALRALRQAAPHAEITLIGLPWAASFVRRFAHLIDHFIVFPGFPGLADRPFDVAAVPSFLAALQAQRFDLAIQLHGSGETSNVLAQLLGASHCAGFHRPPQAPPPGVFLPWRPDEHEVRRCLRLMQALGAPAQNDALEFPVTPADARLLQRSVDRLPAPGTYAVIHAGARLASRRWPAQRFAEVGNALAAAGVPVVLTGTTGEASITRSVAARMGASALDLAGKTELGALAVLVRNARIVVTNDTGMSHMAAALATRSVVVCSGADPDRFAPLDRSRHCVLSAPIACRPCLHAECPIGHPCALAISVEQVLHAIEALLQDDAAPVAPSVQEAPETRAAQTAAGPVPIVPTPPAWMR